MNYNETVNWLFNQLPVYQNDGFLKYKFDLTSINNLCDYLKNPQENFKSVHVAGTNGKGSTSHMLASILAQSGYKVGLYTSPHLYDFRERIKINGKMISKSEVTFFVTKNQLYFKKNKVSFFEMSVAMAFNYFSKESVDIAIIETGLGGRLDATNIINPILSIITNVGLDHQEFLGKSLKEIAKEKAGIIKKGIPIVLSEYQSSIYDVFLNRSKDLVSPLYKSQDISLKDYNTDLNGSFQNKNMKGVIKSVSLMKGFNLSKKNVQKGLLNVVKNTGLRGRWEIIKNSPKTILDVGHNLEAFRLNVREISKINYDNLRIVIGFAEGKKFKKILNILPSTALFYFCQPKISRALDVRKIFNYSMKIGLKGKKFDCVSSAYRTCLNDSKNMDLVFVCGSNFVISEIIHSK